MKQRCLFGVRDDLHEFAEEVVSKFDQIMGAGPLLTNGIDDNTSTSILLRRGRFQVEKCNLAKHSTVTQHIHPSAETIEYGLSGYAMFTINGVCIAGGYDQDRVEKFMHHKMIRIASDSWHGAKVHEKPFSFLSIQMWRSEPAASISHDWVGAPLSAAHEALLRSLT